MHGWCVAHAGIVIVNRRGSAFQLQHEAAFFQVQLVLDLAQHLLVAFFGLAQPLDLLALLADQFFLNLYERVHFLIAELAGQRIFVKAVDPDLVLALHLVEYLGRQAEGVVHLYVLDHGSGNLQPRVLVFFEVAIVCLHVKPPDEQRQREALQHQRSKDHAEGEEDDEVAVGKRQVVANGEGQCQRCRQRHHTSHARPADNGHASQGGFLFCVADVFAEPPRQVGSGENPNEAHYNRGHADEGAIPQNVAEGVVADVVQYAGQLQADEDEDDAVDQEDEGVPHCARLQAGAVIENLGGVVAEEQSAGDHGQHPGGMDFLSGQVGSERGQQREGGVGNGIVGGDLVDPPKHHTHHKANEDAYQRHVQKVDGHQPEDERAGSHGSDGIAVGDQSGGIVDEALSF